MPRVSLLATLFATTAFIAALFATPALADGPFEPNETPAEAVFQSTGQRLTASLETPQDVDWYAFYARPHRQVGVLATIEGSCAKSYGTLRVEVLDGDVAGYGASLGALTLGNDLSKSSVPTTADRVALTTEAGHRYFVKVTQSGCQGTAYGLEIGPAQDLSPTLTDTTPCGQAKSRARATRKRLYGLRAAARGAHGGRRRSLRSRVVLQQQQAVIDEAAAKTACTRPALTRYPFA